MFHPLVPLIRNITPNTNICKLLTKKFYNIGPRSSWLPITATPWPWQVTLSEELISEVIKPCQFFTINYYRIVMEHYNIKKCKQLFEYRHLLLLRDIRGLYHKTYYGRNLRFRDKLECLSVYTRLGWKGLPWTNTLAYYRNRKLRP